MKKIIIAIILVIMMSAMVSAEKGVATLQMSTDQSFQQTVNNPGFFTSLGNYLMSIDDNDALKVYEIGLSIHPRSSDIMNNLGVYYTTKEDYDKAIEYYQMALAENPNYNIAMSNLAIMYHETEQYDEAISQLRKLVNAEPNNPSYNYDLAINIATNIRYNYVGDIDESIAYFEAAENLESDYVRATENIEILHAVKALS